MEIVRKGDVVAFVDQFGDGDEITMDDLAPLFEEPTYEIVRFHQTKPAEVLESGVTIEVAKAWCALDATHGDGWFDGYREE